LVVGSALELPVKSGALGALVLGELLEHCSEPKAALAEAARCCCVGGIVVLSTPNGDYVRDRNRGYKQSRQDLTELKSREFGPAGEDHLFTFRPSELCHLIAEAGLRLLQLGYCGSVLYHPRLRLLRSLAPAWLWRAAGKLTSSIPVLRRHWSDTVVAVCQKPA
jgi:hypothetical protein